MKQAARFAGGRPQRMFGAHKACARTARGASVQPRAMSIFAKMKPACLEMPTPRG